MLILKRKIFAFRISLSRKSFSMHAIRFKVICACLLTALFVTVCFLLSGQFLYQGENPAHLQAFADHYRIYSPPLPDELDFAGEEVPLDRSDVREALDRELMVNDYWQSNLLLYVKRANRWFPLIEPILRQHGIPDDFKYLAVIESGLLNVVSPAKAAGFWQFLKTTGQSYGLEINDYVDERYDVAKATQAACAYLKAARAQCGSWASAAAAYNMGCGGYTRSATAQQCADYWNLYLNAETARYVYRILAVKLIFKNPKQYGLRLRQRDLYQPIACDTLMLDTSVADLRKFAIQQGVSYKTLKECNPWLRNISLPNASKKQYLILLPHKDAMSYRNQLQKITPDALFEGR